MRGGGGRWEMGRRQEEDVRLGRWGTEGWGEEK